MFTGTADLDVHVAYKSAADVFLDTDLYNAHSTAADVLYAGVPIVTFPGTRMASRQASSSHCRFKRMWPHTSLNRRLNRRLNRHLNSSMASRIAAAITSVGLRRGGGGHVMLTYADVC